jgi:hypothetical protein
MRSIRRRGEIHRVWVGKQEATDCKPHIRCRSAVMLYFILRFAADGLYETEIYRKIKNRYCYTLNIYVCIYIYIYIR